MAKFKLASIERELNELKANRPNRNREAGRYEPTTRIWALRKLIGTSLGNELHRHVIVGAVAALQSFHRAILADVISHSDEYKIRGADLIDEKLSFRDALSVTSNPDISVGQLISRAAPCNSVQDLISSSSRVFGIDCKLALSTAVDAFSRDRPAEATPIVDNVDALLARLHETFRLRHILAHEAATDISVEAAEAAASLDAVQMWMSAIEGILWATAFKSVPLTTYEMNIVAKEEVKAARKHLAKELVIARQYALESGKSSLLRRNQIAWKRVAREWVEITYWNRQGSMWGHVGASVLADLFNERAKQLLASNGCDRPR